MCTELWVVEASHCQEAEMNEMWTELSVCCELCVVEASNCSEEGMRCGLSSGVC